MIATMEEGEDDCYCTVIVDETTDPKIRKLSPLQEKFIIVPETVLEQEQQEQEELVELTVPLSMIQPLLPFEQEENTTEQNADIDNADSIILSSSVIATWKERGDQLWKLVGDPAAAASYYERALWETHQISIGSTVILSLQGFPKLAEVDCIEENDKDNDDDCLDVTLVDTGEECTARKSKILLAIYDDDHQDRYQERILLNLSRCLLQLADDVVFANNHSNHHHHLYRKKYLQAAVLATTLVITLSEYYQQQQQQEEQSEADEDTTTTTTCYAATALELRIAAQLALSKFKHAQQDARQLQLKYNHQVATKGTKWLQRIQQKQAQVQKMNKKLAKEMCQLLQDSTTTVAIAEAAPPHEAEEEEDQEAVRYYLER
jgi:hypothetical protein